MADRAFWSQQRVLLTGHTGFKGAWLTVWLTRMGAQVFGMSLAPDINPCLFNLVQPLGLATSTIADIRDRSATACAVAEADPTIVIHLAAQALVRRSYRMPVETFATNVIGTANLLDALRDRPSLRVVLVATTDKVYCNIEDGRVFREGDALGGHDPYSASKAATEIAVSSWAHSFFNAAPIPIVTARAGNVIGGGDWSEDRIVPDVWRAAHAGKPLTLRYPHATRPWQHVLEPLAGYLRYIERVAPAKFGTFPTALNFGPRPNEGLTVAEVAEAMLAALGSPAGWRQEPGSPVVEMQTLALDSTRASETIGWEPRLSSADAITWTAEWYGRVAKGEQALQLCLEQISRYENLS